MSFGQIAVEKFSEATIGYRQDKEVAQTWARLFCTPYFLVSVVSIHLFICCFWLSKAILFITHVRIHYIFTL